MSRLKSKGALIYNPRAQSDLEQSDAVRGVIFSRRTDRTYTESRATFSPRTHLEKATAIS
eukprot:7587288-Pyramimonas_sp.AAC.2